jgi:hypothetical protein
MKTNQNLKIKLALSALALIFSGVSFSQSAPESREIPKLVIKDSDIEHRWSVYWGWNRESYTKSDINFKGSDHNFTLSDVQAKDKQAPLSHLFTTFLNPGKITIPQTNVRVAYKLDTDSAVALNLDHMKYVVKDGQTVSASGYYGSTNYGANGTQLLDPSYMHYEHTDGLNIISLEYEKYYPMTFVNLGVPSRLFANVGAGILYPKSNITMTMLNQTRSDRFHVAGYSGAISGGAEVDFSKRFFGRLAAKVGYVNMPDVVTSYRGDKASQHFMYSEYIMAFGFRF